MNHIIILIIKYLTILLLQVKLISLKSDIASRHGKSFLGDNIQNIINNNVELRTLAVRILTERHTAEYLKIIIEEVLAEYDIPLENVYTCTVDNGSNMVKLIELLRNDQDDGDNSHFDLDNNEGDLFQEHVTSVTYS